LGLRWGRVRRFSEPKWFVLGFGSAAVETLLSWPKTEGKPCLPETMEGEQCIRKCLRMQCASCINRHPSCSHLQQPLGRSAARRATSIKKLVSSSRGQSTSLRRSTREPTLSRSCIAPENRAESARSSDATRSGCSPPRASPRSVLRVGGYCIDTGRLKIKTRCRRRRRRRRHRPALDTRRRTEQRLNCPRDENSGGR
jgi:hypothetical protein